MTTVWIYVDTSLWPVVVRGLLALGGTVAGAIKGTILRPCQGYLGHKNIQHTVRYTELSPGRFKDFWRQGRGFAGRATHRLVQCNVASSSSSELAFATQCSLRRRRSPSISSRTRWQNNLASRRRSPSRTLFCFLNNTTNHPLC